MLCRVILFTSLFRSKNSPFIYVDKRNGKIFYLKLIFFIILFQSAEITQL